VCMSGLLFKDCHAPGGKKSRDKKRRSCGANDAHAALSESTANPLPPDISAGGGGNCAARADAPGVTVSLLDGIRNMVQRGSAGHAKTITHFSSLPDASIDLGNPPSQPPPSSPSNDAGQTSGWEGGEPMDMEAAIKDFISTDGVHTVRGPTKYNVFDDLPADKDAQSSSGFRKVANREEGRVGKEEEAAEEEHVVQAEQNGGWRKGKRELSNKRKYDWQCGGLGAIRKEVESASDLAIMITMCEAE
jgi:hypothetical protein